MCGPAPCVLSQYGYVALKSLQVACAHRPRLARAGLHDRVSPQNRPQNLLVTSPGFQVV